MFICDILTYSYRYIFEVKDDQLHIDIRRAQTGELRVTGTLGIATIQDFINRLETAKAQIVAEQIRG